MCASRYQVDPFARVGRSIPRDRSTTSSGEKSSNIGSQTNAGHWNMPRVRLTGNLDPSTLVDVFTLYRLDPADASVRTGGYHLLHAGLWVILYHCANHGERDGREFVEGKDIGRRVYEGIITIYHEIQRLSHEGKVNRDLRSIACAWSDSSLK